MDNNQTNETIQIVDANTAADGFEQTAVDMAAGTAVSNESPQTISDISTSTHLVTSNVAPGTMITKKGLELGGKIAIVILCAVIVAGAITGAICAVNSTGISTKLTRVTQKEYDKVVAENKALRESLSEMTDIREAGNSLLVSFIPDEPESIEDERSASAERSDDTPPSVAPVSGYEIIVPFIYDSIEYLPEGLAVVSIAGKYGLIDITGKEIVPFGRYDRFGFYDLQDNVHYFIDDMLAVSTYYGGSSKTGFIDRTGRELVSCIYDEVSYIYSGGVYMTSVSGMHMVGLGDLETCKWGVIGTGGKTLLPCKYDEIRYMGDDIFAVYVGDWGTGKWGIADNTGRELVPCKYEDFGCFSEGLAAVKIKNKWGFINKAGTEEIQFLYDSVDAFSEGLATVSAGGTLSTSDYGYSYYEGSKWGVIDKSGREIVTPVYNSVDSYNEGVAIVSIGGILGPHVWDMNNYDGSKWGLIDKTGREIVAPKYNYSFTFSDGLAVVNIGGELVQNEWGSYFYRGSKCGLIDKSGREVLQCKYDTLQRVSEGLVIVVVDGKYGVMDKTGKEIVPPKYDWIDNFNDGIAEVRLDNQDTAAGGYIDKYGLGFDIIGYIDKHGREIVPLEYMEFHYDEGFDDDRSGFVGGYAVLCNEKTGKWGVIDKTGRNVVPFIYDNMSGFYDGLIAVFFGDWDIGKWGVIDITGREIVPIQYEKINIHNGGIAEVKGSETEVTDEWGSYLEESKWGLIVIK